MNLIELLTSDRTEEISTILPLAFWTYYFILNRGYLELVAVFIGIFTLGALIYKGKVEKQIEIGRIKKPKQLGKYISVNIRENFILTFSTFLWLFYAISTIIFGALTIFTMSTDLVTIYLLVLIGFFYRSMVIFLEEENISKVRKIVKSARKQRK